MTRPRRSIVSLEIRVPRSDEQDQRLEKAGVDLAEYDKRWGAYRIRLSPGDVEKHREVLTELLHAAFDARGA